jgi:hypothetical protein
MDEVQLANKLYGRRGADRQSWGRDSIRVIIREIQVSEPKATETRLIALLCERMRDDDDALMAAAEYAVRNVLNSQEHAHANKTATPMTSEKRAERREEIEKIAKQKVQILYLNWQMPNGKLARYCTGKYVASVCTPMAKAGKKAGNKLMGQFYSEESLKAEIES